MNGKKNYTASQIAVELGLDSATVGKIFASMKVMRGGRKYNVGLKIKSNSRSVANPDWEEKNDGVWHYSDEAKTILNRYIELFPSIVKAIKNSQSIDFDGDFSDSELQECYNWARNFRHKTYTRIDIRTGKDMRGIK